MLKTALISANLVNQIKSGLLPQPLSMRFGNADIAIGLMMRDIFLHKEFVELFPCPYDMYPETKCLNKKMLCLINTLKLLYTSHQKMSCRIETC